MTGEDRICYAAVMAGAEYSIGFEQSIACYTATEWTAKFFEYYRTGNRSVEDCCREATDSLENKNGLDSYVVFHRE